MNKNSQSPQAETGINQSQIIKVLQEASAILVGTFELETLLQKIVESYRKISKASACSIFLIDGNKLIMRAGIGYEKDLKGTAEYDLPVKPEEQKIGLTAWIALTKNKFSAKTREELTSHLAWKGRYDGKQYIGDNRCNSFIGIPLIVRNKVIGVLKAENKIPDSENSQSYFTPTEEQILEILANTVAIAIENARLLEEQRKNQSLRIAESIHKISAAVVGTFELDEILQRIVECFKDISNATACAIFLMDDDRRHIRMRAGVGYEENLCYKAVYDLTVNPNRPQIGLTAWIVLTKQKFSAKTRTALTSHPAWKGRYDGQQYKGDERCNSFIGVPLIIRDEVIGVLKAENKIIDNTHTEPYFTQEEEQVFEILSNIAAIVVRATLITKEEKQRVDRLVNLYRIGAMLQEQNDIERLLYIFLTGLTHGKVLGFNRVIYFEYQPITKILVGKMAIGPLNKKEGEKIRNELEAKANSLTIEDCIRAFDVERKALNTELNQLISKKTLDLEKSDFCIKCASKRENVSGEHDISFFSSHLKKFLEKVEVEKVVLIGIASKEKYSFVFCDNIYDKKPFDQSTKELLPVYVGQMSRALERIQVADEIKANKEAAWQEVSAMAAHRLGNILPFTENRLKDALKICGNNKDLNNLLKTCDDDIKVAINVLSDFKTYAAAGRINLTYENNINNLLKELETLFRTNFKDIEIQVNYINQGDTYRLKVDFNAIKIVFINLLSNTKDAKPEYTKVEIWVEIIEKFVKIVYEDNGPGIPDEEKEKIFEPFFTKKSKSSGLGLSIAKRTIEQHGGEISEDGKYKCGAKFNILLPLL